MLRLLAADELDAAFCLLDGEIPDAFTAERLTDEEVVAAFAPDRAPPAPHVTIADLAEQRIVAPRRGSAITSVLAHRFAEARKPMRLALESGDPFSCARSLPEGSPPPSSLGRSPPGRDPPSSCAACTPAAHLPVALVWRGERNLSPPARACIEFVRRETTNRNRRPGITQDPGIAR